MNNLQQFEMKSFALTLLLFFCLYLIGYGQAKNKAVLPKIESTVIKNQQMLKDYFLCSCIGHGFKADSLLYKDHTLSVYTEMLDYTFEDLQKIKKLAQITADGIYQSDLTNKRGILGGCIEYYRSKMLDNTVKSLKLRK